MKIGIITQPLHNNYGGILQNYALQTVLNRMGHDPITLREKCIQSNFEWSVTTIKTVIKKILGIKSSFPPPPYRVIRNRLGIENFIQQYINTTPAYKNYYLSIIDEQKLDAIIVGSDQVWRPIYNKCIEDSFLQFARKSGILKIAYAASFGTENWEFSEEQTQACSKLIKQFCAVSVREESGVDLCKQYFNIDAKWVLDPTLLLDKNDYSSLCTAIPTSTHKYILTYILELTEEKQKKITDFAQRKSLPVKYIQADKNIVKTDTIEAWLAAFRDAEFIITDSFHGTIFSIIFNKPFITIENKDRGINRINSLFKLFNIKCTTILASEISNYTNLKEIDYSIVNNIIKEKESISLDFLNKSLSKNV